MVARVVLLGGMAGFRLVAVEGSVESQHFMPLFPTGKAALASLCFYERDSLY